ncbi:ATP-binding protein [Streptomyces sp. AC550_RSS872]|uniref:ATP-binding protein n=1 Tax=Streptomyces sp. AC550_RSS872 TaxID=2823689 RepID=UPI001C25AE1F|nr:ATP-binding protein [Streptomyces sp. AC550_RSS872]
MVHYFDAEDSLLGSSPQTAERARDMARGFLSVIAPTDVAEAEAVLIVVSELVTNAAVHAGGVTGFELRADPGTVTVSVEDASPDPPRPRRSERTAQWGPGGFGWPLIQELSADVDVCTRPGGKTVRAVLPLAH